ncbi:MAG: HNH endonuclease signature motif containing protein [Elainellaceae cyanobacterium]
MPPESERVSPSLRREVAQRAKQLCEYCRCPEAFSPDSFTIDHIRPRQIGGATASENLAWACFGCNGRKSTKTASVDPVTNKAVALFNPRKDIWQEHFAWNEDATQVVGQTPCGRATVEALALNRIGVVNLRRLLAVAGLHPPK